MVATAVARTFDQVAGHPNTPTSTPRMLSAVTVEIAETEP